MPSEVRGSDNFTTALTRRGYVDVTADREVGQDYPNDSDVVIEVAITYQESGGETSRSNIEVDGVEIDIAATYTPAGRPNYSTARAKVNPGQSYSFGNLTAVLGTLHRVTEYKLS